MCVCLQILTLESNNTLASSGVDPGFSEGGSESGVGLEGRS